MAVCVAGRLLASVLAEIVRGWMQDTAAKLTGAVDGREDDVDMDGKKIKRNRQEWRY